VVVVLVSFYNLNEIKSTIKTTYWQRKVGGAPFKLVKNTNSKKENHCQSTSDKNFFTKHESRLKKYKYLVEDTHQNTDRG
jgi:hypothetical protein